MIKRFNILNQYDNYGLRRLLEMAGNKSFSMIEAKKFRKWAYAEGLKNVGAGRVNVWLKNKTIEYIK